MDKDLEFTLHNKISDAESLHIRIKFWKSTGYKIVFTNGVFDLIHLGHLSYLYKAARLGDKLVIGINSDFSVKQIKGPDRPINNQQTRIALLASLYYVDLVVAFDSDNPLSLITQIKPDVLVKGGDYTAGSIVGSKEVLANGGKVEIIPFVHGHSSTSIINKIKDHALSNNGHDH